MIIISFLSFIKESHLFSELDSKIISIAIFQLILFSFAFFYMKNNKLDKLFNLKFNLNYILIGIIFGISLLVLEIITLNYLFKLDIETNQSIFSQMSLLEYFLLTCILAPICEETFFRGLIGRIIKSDYLFYLTSAMLFSLAHFDKHDDLISILTPIIATFISGLVYAILYRKTNNLITPIMTHFSHNFLIFILQIITQTS